MCKRLCCADWHCQHAIIHGRSRLDHLCFICHDNSTTSGWMIDGSVFWFICQILQYNHRQHNTFLFHNAISSFAKYLHTYINGMASCSNNHNWPSVLYITFLFPSKSSYILKRPQNIWTLKHQNFLLKTWSILGKNLHDNWSCKMFQITVVTLLHISSAVPGSMATNVRFLFEIFRLQPWQKRS